MAKKKRRNTAHKAMSAKLKVGGFKTFKVHIEASRFYHHLRRNGGARIETLANSWRVYRVK